MRGIPFYSPYDISYKNGNQIRRYCIEQCCLTVISNSVPWEKEQISWQRGEGRRIEESRGSINFDSRADTTVSKCTERTCRYTYRVLAYVTSCVHVTDAPHRGERNRVHTHTLVPFTALYSVLFGVYG